MGYRVPSSPCRHVSVGNSVGKIGRRPNGVSTDGRAAPAGTCGPCLRIRLWRCLPCSPEAPRACLSRCRTWRAGGRSGRATPCCPDPGRRRIRTTEDTESTESIVYNHRDTKNTKGKRQLKYFFYESDRPVISFYSVPFVPLCICGVSVSSYLCSSVVNSVGIPWRPASGAS